MSLNLSVKLCVVHNKSFICTVCLVDLQYIGKYFACFYVATAVIVIICLIYCITRVVTICRRMRLKCI